MSDIVVSNLKCGYGDKVIFDGFDVTFKENAINVVLGGSGVGKTTLLNVLAGLKTYDGEISNVDGEVSYIFQKDRLIPTISVYKNLDLSAVSSALNGSLSHNTLLGYKNALAIAARCA